MMDKNLMKRIAMYLILAIFVVAGINKVKGFDGTVKGFMGMMPKDLKKLPLVLFQLVILMVILIEIVAPLVLVYMDLDENNTLPQEVHNISVWLLVGFTALATILYHNPMDKSQMTNFLKNLAIIGGLLLLLQ